MNTFISGTLAVLLLAAPAMAKEGYMAELEKKTEKIIDRYDHHIKKIRKKDSLSPEMKALLMKQAEETKNLRLKHLNEKTALRMKQKKETEALRNAAGQDDEEAAMMLYVEEINVLEPVASPPAAGDIKNPNRQKQTSGTKK